MFLLELTGFVPSGLLFPSLGIVIDMVLLTAITVGVIGLLTGVIIMIFMIFQIIILSVFTKVRLQNVADFADNLLIGSALSVCGEN